MSKYGIGAGSRGGSIPPSTPDEADAGFEEHRRNEYEALKVEIMRLANYHGEFHSEMLADYPLSERNMIGTAVRGLARSNGPLRRTGMIRKSTSPARHGGISYVYVPREVR